MESGLLQLLILLNDFGQVTEPLYFSCLFGTAGLITLLTYQCLLTFIHLTNIDRIFQTVDDEAKVLLKSLNLGLRVCLLVNFLLVLVYHVG